MPIPLQRVVQKTFLRVGSATLSASGQVGGYTNLPPVWTTVPIISFTQGLGEDKSIDAYESDPNPGETTSVSYIGGTLPNGVTFVSASKVYRYNGIEAPGSTDTSRLRSTDNGIPPLSTDSNLHRVEIVSNLQWSTTPAPSFVEGATNPYNLGQHIPNYNPATDEFSVDPLGTQLTGANAWLSLTGTGGVNLTPNGTQVDASDFSGLILRVRRSGGAWVSSAAFGVTVEAANTSDWVPNILTTGLSTLTGRDMPPGGCKHLRWDYHAASQSVYVCGGDWSSPFYTSGGGDYNTVMFKYTGNGVWTRDYPYNAGAPMYDCNIGPSGDFQPPPHCEASFSWIGGDKFLVADYRTDWNTEGPFPAAWTTGVSRPGVGFATMVQATQPMEYDRVTRKWAKRSDITYIGQAQGAEMATFEPTRNVWLRIRNNDKITATNVTTGAYTLYSIDFPDHPADGRSESNKIIYRLTIVGDKCYVYNHSLWPYPPYPTTWPIYIFWFWLTALDTPAVRVHCYHLASLWDTQIFPNTVVASEQDMVYVANENALLIWGEAAMTNIGSEALNYTPNARSNPESYFVDIDTGAKRPGPPLPRGRNGIPYRPSNTIYFPPTQEIVTHGTVAFRDPYLNASSESGQFSVEESRQYTIYKRGTNLPAWAKLTSEGGSLSLYQWYQIPNSSIRVSDPVPLRPESEIGSPNSKVDDWNGFAFRKRGSYLYSAANGGHTDYGGNEVDCFCLNTDTPRWYTMKAQSPVVPTTFSGFNGSHYSDGSPVARHTYHSSHYIENFNRVYLLGRASSWPTNTTGVQSDAYDIDTNTWLAAGTVPDLLGGPNDKCQAQHPETDDVYIIQHGGVGATVGLMKFSATTGAFSLIPTGALTSVATAACVIDPVRNRMVVLHSGFGNMVVDLTTAAVTAVSLTGPAAGLLDFSPQNFSAQHVFGLAYDSVSDCYYAKPSATSQLGSTISNKVVKITPATWYCEELSVSGTVPLTTNETIYTRFRYVPEMRGLVYYPKCDTGAGQTSMYFMRTS